ncbi:hypothetical protein [Brevibacillus daliensis]|uniref:hypothetical protein n=1 Tax=Brevibacillus daliensis TaxID=2892995 RepID=UPI001E52F8C5|nr:hypothetical protein [Brevibacillus daliensis]
MDRSQIKKLISQIRVFPIENQDVEVKNYSPLPMLGKGRQGAVFLLDEHTCVKVYGDPDDCERERYAMKLGQKTNLLPRLYDYGRNYLVMERVRGIDLREYLQAQPLTKELSYKLIQMLITFKEIGYERIDHHKRQIYLLPSGDLKVIDVGRTVWRDRTYPYPRKLLTSLGNKYKKIFLTHVQEMAPELFKEWVHYIDMDQLARDIIGKVSENPIVHGDRLASEATIPLLSMNNYREYHKKLEGLVRKVYKEEKEKQQMLTYVESYDYTSSHRYSERSRHTKNYKRTSSRSRVQDNKKRQSSPPTKRSYNNQRQYSSRSTTSNQSPRYRKKRVSQSRSRNTYNDIRKAMLFR